MNELIRTHIQTREILRIWKHGEDLKRNDLYANKLKRTFISNDSIIETLKLNILSLELCCVGCSHENFSRKHMISENKLKVLMMKELLLVCEDNFHSYKHSRQVRMMLRSQGMHENTKTIKCQIRILCPDLDFGPYRTLQLFIIFN